jgi:hypothetical protein
VPTVQSPESEELKLNKYQLSHFLSLSPICRHKFVGKETVKRSKESRNSRGIVSKVFNRNINMSVLLHFEEYQKARVKFVQAIAEAATRPQNIEVMHVAGVMQLLRPLLLDNVRDMQRTSELEFHIIRTAQ